MALTVRMPSAGGRINHHIVVILQQWSERVFELERRVELAGELLLDLRQGELGRGHEKHGIFCRFDDGGYLGTMIAEHVKHGGLYVSGIKESDGGVGLRVEIDQQRLFLSLSDGGGEIDGSGGLTHAALLVGNSQDGRHRMPCPL